MFSTFLALTFLFLMFMWSLAWVNYYNKLDKRFGSSLWRWSYDYPVPGDRDISFLDDKKFVILRRKRNRAVTVMYFILFFSFFIFLSFVTQILYAIQHSLVGVYFLNTKRTLQFHIQHKITGK